MHMLSELSSQFYTEITILLRIQSDESDVTIRVLLY